MAEAESADEAGRYLVGVELHDATGGPEKEPEKQPGSWVAIYVDGSVLATLGYSETTETYRTMQEARTAWLALPFGVKKDASITIKGGGCYRGWDIYRLFPR